jgi:L-lactate dehydrogenase complex protein LldE
MRVGLFVTCLVDLMRPRIGFAALRLLEAAGCEVVVPSAQTCCGQPGYNGGDRAGARKLAQKLIAEFEGCEYVVAPSGSCAGMIRAHYPELFSDAPQWQERVRVLAAKTYIDPEFVDLVLQHRDLRGEGAVSLLSLIGQRGVLRPGV